MLPSQPKMNAIVLTCLLLDSVLAGYPLSGESSSWSGIANSYGSGSLSNFGEHSEGLGEATFGHNDHYQVGHEGTSNFGGFDGGHGNYGGHSGLVHAGSWEQHQYAHSYPISQHIEVSRPVTIPIYKNIGVPVPQPVAIKVPHIVAIGVAQPYPVHVPVSHPVAIPVTKTVAIAVEKKVPYPIEKIIPVPVEKPVPITIEKHIPVPVEKPYPIHIPVYKHIFHRAKHGHGWAR